MKHKKDIGTLFENKLKEGEKVPNDNLWEKINTSLDEENRKRKKAIFYWLLSGGIFALLGFLLIISNGMLSTTATKIDENDTNLSEESSTTPNKEINKTTFEVLKADSISNNNDEQLSRIITTKEDSIKQSKITSAEKATSTSKITSSKNKITDNTVRVSEKYYYYNSRDGKQIVTEDKAVIDSLISETNKTLDSTTIKKKDSLK